MNNNNTNPTATNNSTISVVYLPIEWLTETPPEQEFCINPLAPIDSVTLINAHGGTGKSLLALKMAVHVALGLPILGAATNGGKAAYMSLEDPTIVLQGRLYKIVQSMSKEHSIDLEELTSKVMIIDRYGLQTPMAVLESGNVKISPIADDVCSLVKEHNIKCLIIDTFIRTNTLNENDNAQMGALLVAFEQVAKEAECAVILLHHLPKEAGKKAYSARGASAITDNARSVLLLETVNPKDESKFVEEEIKAAALKERLVRVTHTKHNYSQKHSEQYFEIDDNGVPLEKFPTMEEKEFLAQRYMELYNWWVSVWKSKPLTKTNIEQNVSSIRPDNSNYGKEQYKKAIDWAIEKQLAKKVSAPAGGSKNSKANYYTLTPIEEQ